jgi:hypothetical protein
MKRESYTGILLCSELPGNAIFQINGLEIIKGNEPVNKGE